MSTPLRLLSLQRLLELNELLEQRRLPPTKPTKVPRKILTIQNDELEELRKLSYNVAAAIQAEHIPMM